MWSGLTFNEQQVVDNAIPLVNKFMPLIYIVGGIAIFALFMVVVIVVVKRAGSTK